MPKYKFKRLAVLSLSALIVAGCASKPKFTSKGGRPPMFEPKGYVKNKAIVNPKGSQPALAPVNSFSSENFGKQTFALYDNDLSTRWSSKGEQVWLVLDYGQQIDMNAARLAFFKGDQRVSKFDILISQDGTHWTEVLHEAESSGMTVNYQLFPFANVKARYIKFIGHGNTYNHWSALTEFQTLDCKVNTCAANEL